MNFDFDLLESIYSKLDYRYGKGKGTVVTVTGVKSFMIPEWYNGRFTESGLEAKVVGENRKNFAAAMRHGMEKAEELKKEL